METMLFHPKLVHVPIALAILMPLVAGSVLVAWWRRWLPRQTWLLAVGLQAILVGSGILALQSGEAEEERVESIVAERFLETHESAAQRFVLASGAVLGLMVLGAALGSRAAGRPLATAATAGTFLVLALGYETGQAGGHLVYTHGAAQAHAGPAGAPQHRTAAPDGDDDDD